MKNFEELKENIKAHSFNESVLSSAQVVDLEIVIDLIEEFEKCNLNISSVRKSSPLIEGKTKSNVKNNTQIGRLAPPPPPIKR